MEEPLSLSPAPGTLLCLLELGPPGALGMLQMPELQEWVLSLKSRQIPRG